ncbi:MAG: Holliday junction resolvase RuvX [Planctomycetaceae bacterium]|nr:Holliday junction resolvase RuvX [Planctomycetaceae bacterium]
MPHSSDPSGVVAGIDYGAVRIGVAVSDPRRVIAFPLTIYTRKNETRDAEFFRKLTVDERITQFVVGLPLHLSGDLSDKAREALAFGRWLGELTGVPIDYYDERYTSVEAEDYLLEANVTRKKRKQKLDKVAAQILLTGYLESGCRGTTQTLPLDDEE